MAIDPFAETTTDLNYTGDTIGVNYTPVTGDISQFYEPVMVQTPTVTAEGVSGFIGSGQYGAQNQSVVDRLNQLIQNGGYSQEQKDKLIGAAFNPVQQQAQGLREQAQADAYSRGLGQSSALSRSYGNIDRDTLNALTQITGQVESEGQKASMDALKMFQEGQSSEAEKLLQAQQMQIQNDQFNAQLEQEREALLTNLGMEQADYQLMVQQLNQAAELQARGMENDYNLAIEQIAAQYDLTEAELNQASELADKERQSDFISGIIESILGLGGTIAGAAIAASDKKLKKNIEPTDSALAKISKMEAVSWDWKDPEKYGAQDTVGFLAQKIKKVVPEMVKEIDDEGTLGIQYSHPRMMALLVKAIQELNQKIDGGKK